MRRSPRGPLLARSPASCGTAANNLAVASQTVTSETYGCRPAEIPRGGSFFSTSGLGRAAPSRVAQDGGLEFVNAGYRRASMRPLISFTVAASGSDL
jgi:hypothetical protein